MTTRLFALACIFALWGLAACESPDADEQPLSEEPVEVLEPPSEIEPETYSTRGTVRSVTPSGNHVMIHHEEIPGFMDAMTMPFDVPDTLDVSHLERDDRIEFTFEASSEGNFLKEITVVDENGNS